MPAQIITSDDLREFRNELLECIKGLFEAQKVQREVSEKKWLKSCEVRKLLQISVGTLQNLRLKGALPFTKIGGSLYYDYDDIQKILELNKKNNSLI